MNNKYIKKSVEIEAIQWNGNNLEEIMKFLNSELSYGKNTDYVTQKFSYYKTTNNLYINTLEGNMKTNIGDYIIKGVKGEYYPCKPDIFELTYEKVYTLEEVKKEWETLGYTEITHSKDKQSELIFRNYNEAEIVIYLNDKDYFKYSPYRRIITLTYQEHQLLTKTFKALGWLDE